MTPNGTIRPYDPQQPSLITLQVRVTPHPVDPTRSDLQVGGLQTANLPGGWTACHGLLLEAAKIVLHKALTQTQKQSLIEVAQELPGGR